MRTPRTVLAVAATALAVLAVPATAQQSADVEVVDNAFEPAEVTVEAGGSVTWSQTGSLPHSVTADDGSFDSHPDCGDGGDCMQTGDTFSQTFSEPGEYAYYCRIHGGPGGVGMSGVVTVTAADDGEPTEEPTDEPTEEPTEEETDDGAEVTGSISVSDQTGDGTSVLVDSVTISGASGFVVVHADDDGAPGAVLGHVAIDEGTSTNVSVSLDEALSADATVWPMLHEDAGAVGTYEFPGPDGPVMADGAVVMESLAFTVSADAGGLPVTGIPLALLVAVGLLTLAAGAAVVRRLSPEGGSGTR